MLLTLVVTILLIWKHWNGKCSLQLSNVETIYAKKQRERFS